MTESDGSTPHQPSFTIYTDDLASVLPKTAQESLVFVGDGDWNSSIDPDFVPYPFSQFPFETFSSPCDDSLSISKATVDDNMKGGVRFMSHESSFTIDTADMASFVPKMTEGSPVIYGVGDFSYSIKQDGDLPPVIVDDNTYGDGFSRKDKMRADLYKSWLESFSIWCPSVLTLEGIDTVPEGWGVLNCEFEPLSEKKKRQSSIHYSWKCGQFGVLNSHKLLKFIG